MENPKSQTLPVTRESTTSERLSDLSERKGRFSPLQLNATAQEVMQVIRHPHLIGQSDPNQPRWGSGNIFLPDAQKVKVKKIWCTDH